MLDFKGLFDKKRLMNILEVWSAQFLKSFREIVEKSRDLAKTNFELGKFHFYKHNLSDAIMRFKIVAMLKPQIPELQYFLARCYEVKRDRERALDLYSQILQSEPKHSRASFRYGYLSGQKVDAVPLEIMEENADYAAHNYNAEHKAEIAALKELVSELANYCGVDGDRKVFFEKILDLGCNTGICGELLLGNFHYEEMTMTSVSQRMLDVTGTNIYTKLVHSDLHNFLDSDRSKYELVVASNALNSYSQIDPVLKDIILHLSDDGVVVLLLNDLQVGGKQFDVETMEFAVSQDHIKSLLSKLKVRDILIKSAASKEGIGKMLIICRAPN